MDSIGYRPLEYSSPKPKKRPFRKAFLLLFALSLLFIRQAGDIAAVEASEQTSQPPTLLSKADEYLAVARNAPKPPVFAKSYVLLDPKTAEVVVSQNPDASVPIASTTKMVTALVARQLFKLNETVTVSSLAANINGSDIQLMLGEKISVHELLKGLMIQSGNDAAFALADHYSPGDNEYKTFVAKMNEYVQAAGLKNSVFGDPAGLDDETGRSTAWDLAHIARLVLADPVLRDIVSIPKTTITSVDGSFVHELTNSNRLLLGDSPYYLPGALGVKTGFTPDAGHCLVSAYQSVNGLLIGVVLNTAEYSITASASESRKLFMWADRYVETRSY